MKKRRRCKICLTYLELITSDVPLTVYLTHPSPIRATKWMPIFSVILHHFLHLYLETKKIIQITVYFVSICFPNLRDLLWNKSSPEVITWYLFWLGKYMTISHFFVSGLGERSGQVRSQSLCVPQAIQIPILTFA